jgi:hypothetical protein
MDGEQLHQMDRLKEEARNIASASAAGADDSLSNLDLMMPPVKDALSKSQKS